MTLFDDGLDPARASAPLAVRMRPRSVDEVVGQDDALAPGSPLLREWVDDPDSTAAGLEQAVAADEAAWLAQRAPFLIY